MPMVARGFIPSTERVIPPVKFHENRRDVTDGERERNCALINWLLARTADIYVESHRLIKSGEQREANIKRSARRRGAPVSREFPFSSPEVSLIRRRLMETALSSVCVLFYLQTIKLDLRGV